MKKVDAILESLKIWSRLVETGADVKSQVMTEAQLKLENRCPLCEYVKQKDSRYSSGAYGQVSACKKNCPIKKWGTIQREGYSASVSCEFYEDSPWVKWGGAAGADEHKEYAAQLVTLLLKALSETIIEDAQQK